jgi:hypothetical protein
VNVSLDIYAYSTPAETILLNQAYAKGKNHGLVADLSKMKTVGHFSIKGRIGYDVSYINVTDTPTGRKVVFVTTRAIPFRQSYYDLRSAHYNLTVGEIDVDKSDKSKSTGFLYPEAKIAMNKDGQLQYGLVCNPMKLRDVLDWKGTPGVN